MSDTITVTGVVATEPRQSVHNGLEIASFRLASTARRQDPATQQWVDGATNWYTVSAFRRLAGNVAASIHKGQRVVVTGRLRVREWQAGDKSGTSVEIDADSLGHDLLWGTSTFSRTTASASADAAPGGMDASASGSTADSVFGASSDADAFAAAAAPLNPPLAAVGADANDELASPF